jgi:two-component system response regulator AtoC
VLSQGEVLLREAVVDQQRVQTPLPAVRPEASTPLPAPVTDAHIPTLDEMEREHIARVYALTKGHKGRTCEVLGISRPTLERKLRKYGLSGMDEG